MRSLLISSSSPSNLSPFLDVDFSEL
jgi:hypothetical protein